MNKLIIPFIFFILSFYCFGAGIMDSFVVYHSWLYVGAEEFAAMHIAASERIVPLLVLPTFILTLLCVLMFWKRPSPISKMQVWLALAMLMAGWLSSAFIQIPIQTQLSEGKNDVLLNKLIVSDWIRVVAWFIYISTIIKMLLQIITAYKVKQTATV